MTQSTATGGYVVARPTDLLTGEDDTILDHSLYTNDHTYNSTLEKSTVISTATTVKQGQQQLRFNNHQLRPRSVLETEDIQPFLEKYQQNRQLRRLTPTVVVTPDSSNNGSSQQFLPEYYDDDPTPRRGSRSKSLPERGSVLFDNPSAFNAWHSMPLDPTDSTTEASTTERIQARIEPSNNSAVRFELAAMEELPQRKQPREDGENSSVHSFSFSQTEEEIGFEVDEPWPEMSNNHASTKVYGVHDDCDQESIPSEPGIDVESRINLTDSELLDGRSSPGALRLTAEGLEQHEKKTFQEARRNPERHTDEFEAWRKEHETRKWYRKKLKEREEKLLDRTMQLRETLIIPEHEPVKRCSVGFRPENDVADLSLAPLASMQHLSINNDNSPSKRRSFQLFRKKGKPTAEELLQRERQRAREAKRLKEYQQRQERERIARKRNAYLEQQRAKEIVSGGALTRTTSVDDTHPTNTTLSSISTATPALPYCVLCLEEVRTHIATPCMHFSFCSDCVERLEASDKNECPVCRQPNVTYASVAV